MAVLRVSPSAHSDSTAEAPACSASITPEASVSTSTGTFGVSSTAPSVIRTWAMRSVFSVDDLDAGRFDERHANPLGELGIFHRKLDGYR